MSNPAKTKRTKLERNLTSPQISMIALSTALGTGLFLGAGSTISFAGPATIIAYILAGALAFSIVWALAEMVSTHAMPGGHGAIAAVHLGKFGGYVTRWNFAITMLIVVGAEVVATATYLQHWFPGLSLGAGTIACALFIIFLNLASVKLYGSTEYWFSMLKVLAVVVFILLGASIIFVGWPSPNAPIGIGNLTAHGGFAPKGISGILMAACFAVFSFGGIENISVATAESKNPKKDVPSAVKRLVWQLGLFYVLAMTIIVTLQPWTTTVKESGNADSSPFVKVLATVGIPAAGHVMNVVLIVAALSAANGALYAGSRMVHSLALDKMAPAFTAHTSKNGAPRGAVILVSILFLSASTIAIFSPNDAFMMLYGGATVGIIVTWITIMLTHIKFRKSWNEKHTTKPNAYMWGTPITDYIIIAAAIAVFIALRTALPIVWTAGIPYLVILMLSFFVLNKVRKLPEAQALNNN